MQAVRVDDLEDQFLRFDHLADHRICSPPARRRPAQPAPHAPTDHRQLHPAGPSGWPLPLGGIDILLWHRIGQFAQTVQAFLGRPRLAFSPASSAAWFTRSMAPEAGTMTSCRTSPFSLPLLPPPAAMHRQAGSMRLESSPAPAAGCGSMIARPGSSSGFASRLHLVSRHASGRTAPTWARIPCRPAGVAPGCRRHDEGPAFHRDRALRQRTGPSADAAQANHQ